MALNRNRRLYSMPEADALSGIKWQLFVSLTFARQRIPYHRRIHMIFALFRRIAKSRAPFEKLLFCYRLEKGTDCDHLHFHALIGGLSEVDTKLCSNVQEFWQGLGGGISEISLYDAKLNGVGYALKISYSSFFYFYVPIDAPLRGETRRAVKEVPKYGKSNKARDDETDIPTLSRSVFALLRKQNG